jgi:mRNA interferase RelE/StbE
MYSVKFTQTAEKQFCKLEKNIQERVVNVLERITINPFHFVKRKEETSYFILRIGEYRAILDIQQDNHIIFVMELGHRKNIYNN